MYLASKFEDVFPLNSKIVSEKIAHNTMTVKEIVNREQEFLELFDFQVDFVTHYDFYETFMDKIFRLLNIKLTSAKSSIQHI